MIRSLSKEEVSSVSGGMTMEPIDGGNGWGWSDSLSFFGDGGAGSTGNGDYNGGDIIVTANIGDGSWANSSDNNFAGFNQVAASGGTAQLPFNLNSDGSIPAYTDPNTGDIVVTAPYTNTDYNEAHIAVEAVVTSTAVASASVRNKLLQAIGVGGSTLAGMNVDQMTAQVATAQRNAKNEYGYNLYKRLYDN